MSGPSTPNPPRPICIVSRPEADWVFLCGGNLTMVRGPRRFGEVADERRQFVVLGQSH